MSTEKTANPEWMQVCKGDGTPLYWLAADGRQRSADDPPPRSEWSAEMKVIKDAE